jgi:hypothetical protein
VARVSDSKPRGLLSRVIFFVARRKLGKVTGPMKITAHHKHVLVGVGFMENAQLKATRVPKPLKALASTRTAALVGCVF